MTQKEFNIKDCLLFDSRSDVIKYMEGFQIRRLVTKSDPPKTCDDGYELPVSLPDADGCVTVKIATVYVAIFAAFSALNALDWGHFYFVIDFKHSEGCVCIFVFIRRTDKEVGFIQLSIGDEDEFWVEEEHGPWAAISPSFYQSFGIEHEDADDEEDYFFKRFGNKS